MSDEPTRDGSDPVVDHADPATRASDLARRAEANLEATFGEQETSRVRVPGVISGDVGPKGRASAQLRSLSRHERAEYGDVPRGSASPNGAMLLLVPMLAIAALLIAIVVLVGWLLS